MHRGGNPRVTNATNDTERKAILDSERSINEQYRREVDRLLGEQPNLNKQIALVQSQRWTTTALPQPGIDLGATAAVIGRVALTPDHPYAGEDDGDLGTTFYIASWRVKQEAYETVNWAAPVAGLYFKGRESELELAPYLTGRRTFVLHLEDLVDYSDDLEDGTTDPFVASPRNLQIPAAPKRHRPTPTPSGVDRPEPATPTQKPIEAPPQETPAAPRAETTTRPDRLASLRAADAVTKVMEMPKEGRMGFVLPTMQPDQYEFVAAPSSRNLLVQGQPGTGKTVIAAHRAVFLTSAERKGDRVDRIALVGPSDHYVDHVEPIIAELKEPQAEVTVLSLAGLLRSISGLRSYPKPGPIGRIESSWELGRVIDDFVKSMADRPKSGRIEHRVRHVIEALTAADSSQVPSNEIRDWLHNLPRWNEIIAHIRYLPVLATAALSLDPRAAGDLAGHLIVDEAQDVRPLEWRILQKALLQPGGSVSLFGDMNQRRSDWTAASWQELAEDLELTDDDGTCEVHELARGYRSTRQILKFANQLLPRGERGEQALRDGPQPTIMKVTQNQCLASSVDAAIELTVRHTGMVALISNEHRRASAELRERTWSPGRHQHSWTQDDRTIAVLHPDEARGLEFDAAVVVEPGDFLENVGRHGVLYTSLTRANKELIVVHSRPLPRGLRPPR